MALVPDRWSQALAVGSLVCAAPPGYAACEFGWRGRGLVRLVRGKTWPVIEGQLRVKLDVAGGEVTATVVFADVAGQALVQFPEMAVGTGGTVNLTGVYLVPYAKAEGRIDWYIAADPDDAEVVAEEPAGGVAGDPGQAEA